MIENRKILIVDDERFIQKLFMHILSPPLKPDILSRGAALFGETGENSNSEIADRFDLTVADCGKDAIRAVQDAVDKNEPFTVAFIDHRMPGMDGVETARQILKIDPDMRIVFISGSMDFDLERFRVSICREDVLYLQKPFGVEEVRTIVKTLFRQCAIDEKMKG